MHAVFTKMDISYMMSFGEKEKKTATTATPKVWFATLHFILFFLISFISSSNFILDILDHLCEFNLYAQS